MKCKNCKHWGNDYEPEMARLKSCNSPNHVSAITASDHEINRTPDDGVLTECEEGWGMLAGAEFGCVNFEARQ
jgi:hypothetical protein